MTDGYGSKRCGLCSPHRAPAQHRARPCPLQRSPRLRSTERGPARSSVPRACAAQIEALPAPAFPAPAQHRDRPCPLQRSPRLRSTQQPCPLQRLTRGTTEACVSLCAVWPNTSSSAALLSCGGAEVNASVRPRYIPSGCVRVGASASRRDVT